MKTSTEWLSKQTKWARYDKITSYALGDNAPCGAGTYSLVVDSTAIFGVVNDATVTLAEPISISLESLNSALPDRYYALTCVDAKKLRKEISKTKKYDRAFLRIEPYTHSTGYQITILADNKVVDTDNHDPEFMTIIATVNAEMHGVDLSFTESTLFRIEAHTWYDGLLGFDSGVWVFLALHPNTNHVSYVITDKTDRFFLSMGFAPDRETFAQVDKALWIHVVKSYLDNYNVPVYKHRITRKMDLTWTEQHALAKWARYANIDFDGYYNTNYVPYAAAHGIAMRWLADRKDMIKKIQNRNPLVIRDSINNTVSIDGKPFKAISETNRRRLSALLEDCGYSVLLGIDIELDKSHGYAVPLYGVYVTVEEADR